HCPFPRPRGRPAAPPPTPGPAARRSSARSPASSAGRSACATTATRTPATATTTGANRHAPDVALADRGVPCGLDLAGVVEVNAAVDDDEGIGNTVDRAVQVVEDRGLIAPVAVIVVAPLIFHRRGIHPLGGVE